MPYRDRRRQRYAEDPVFREKILAVNQAYRKLHKEKFNRLRRLRDRRGESLKTRYGISIAQYNAMLEEQGGVCAICGEQPEEERLCVDHSHATGKIRGLLCRRCNSGLGCYNDELRLTMGASAYLRRALLRHAAEEDGFPISELLR